MIIYEKDCICYFSGTGMTQYVVNKLVKEFEKYHVIVDCFRIEDLKIRDVELSKNDLFGISYPFHAFNAPKIVIDFASHLPKVNGLDTLLLGLWEKIV